MPLGFLVDDFRRMKQPDGFVFPPMCYEFCRETLHNAAVAAGITIPRFGWHTLRAMHATWLKAIGGADALDMMAQLGHADPKTTAVYTQPDEAGMERKVRALQEWLTGGVQ